MKSQKNATGGLAGPVRRPGRLWLWFLAGFVPVFVGMLLLVTMTEMHPSGQYAVQYPLWQYYGVMLARLFGPSLLGPASGGTAALVATGVVHLLLSAAGGCAVAAVGWCVMRGRQDVTS